MAIVRATGCGCPVAPWRSNTVPADDPPRRHGLNKEPGIQDDNPEKKRLENVCSIVTVAVSAITLTVNATLPSHLLSKLSPRNTATSVHSIRHIHKPIYPSHKVSTKVRVFII